MSGNQKEEDVHLPKINSFVSLHILTIIKAKVQNTELYITIIPSFQRIRIHFCKSCLSLEKVNQYSYNEEILNLVIFRQTRNVYAEKKIYTDGHLRNT